MSLPPPCRGTVARHGACQARWFAGTGVPRLCACRNEEGVPAISTGEHQQPFLRHPRLGNQPLSQDFAVIADAFVELQEARHAADYDPSVFHETGRARDDRACGSSVHRVESGEGYGECKPVSRRGAIREEMALSCLMVAGSFIEVSRAAFDDRPLSA